MKALKAFAPLLTELNSITDLCAMNFKQFLHGNSPRLVLIKCISPVAVILLQPLIKIWSQPGGLNLTKLYHRETSQNIWP